MSSLERRLARVERLLLRSVQQQGTGTSLGTGPGAVERYEAQEASLERDVEELTREVMNQPSEGPS